MKQNIYFNFCIFFVVMSFTEAAPNGTARVDINPLIVGGNAVEIKDYPYQASIRVNGKHDCGGSLISATWILTAAHCLRRSLCVYSINLGSTDSTKDGKLYKPKQIIPHTSYAPGKKNFDVGLIELTEAADLTFPGIGIIPLAAATLEVADATVTTTSGWGVTRADGTTASDILQAVSIPVFNNAQCKTIYTPIYGADSVDDFAICAGLAEGGKDACIGDSGGPLVTSAGGAKTLVGVVSFGKGCAEPNFPGVYMKVAKFRPWIQTNAGL